MLARMLILLLSLSVCVSYASDDNKTVINAIYDSLATISCDDSLTLNGQPIEVNDKRNKKKKKDKDKGKKKYVEPVYSESERLQILEALNGVLDNSSDPRSSTINDILTSSFVVKLKSGLNSYWTLSLLLGNSTIPYTEKEIKDMETFLGKIIERGWLIVHDAESTAAPIISRIAGNYSVAVGTSKTPNNIRSELNNFVIIDDPYIRLSTFGQMDHRAFSTDSLTGMAVLVNGDMKSHVPFARTELTDSPSEWGPKMGEPSLGYTSLATPSKIQLSKYLKKADPPLFVAKDVLKSLETKTLGKILNFLNELNIGSRKIAEHTNGIDGALVIGSGKLPGYYTQEIYRIVKSFADYGVPIVTGGSGGVMEIANSAAFDAGGVSIGIPIIGIESLANEKDISSDVQTLTIPTSGYTSRIPLLLKNKKFILIAPGGSGTMKEIATILMQQNLHPDPEMVLMFIGKKYFGPLVEGLKKYLPKFITDGMFVVDNAEEAIEVFNELPKTIWSKLDWAKLRTTEKINPRNNKKSYEEPKSSSFWSFE